VEEHGPELFRQRWNRSCDAATHPRLGTAIQTESPLLSYRQKVLYYLCVADGAQKLSFTSVAGARGSLISPNLGASSRTDISTVLVSMPATVEIVKILAVRIPSTGLTEQLPRCVCHVLGKHRSFDWNDIILSQ